MTPEADHSITSYYSKVPAWRRDFKDLTRITGHTSGTVLIPQVSYDHYVVECKHGGWPLDKAWTVEPHDREFVELRVAP